jgi:hypothetical protein
LRFSFLFTLEKAKVILKLCELLEVILWAFGELISSRADAMGVLGWLERMDLAAVVVV